MSGLLDAIDRLASSSNAIKNVTYAKSIARSSAEDSMGNSDTLPASSSTEHLRTYEPGPFSRALFTQDDQSIVREIDDAELGLFALTFPSPAGQRQPTKLQVPHPDSGFSKVADGARKGGSQGDAQITRKPAVEATPLRNRRVAKPSGPPTSAAGREYDPEVYAEAALRYLDKYPTVQSLPKARAQAISLLNRLEETRNSIEELQLQLQGSSVQRAASPKTQAVVEERKILELQERILKLRRKKDDLLRARQTTESASRNQSEVEYSESEVESEAEGYGGVDPDDSVAESPTPAAQRAKGRSSRRESRLPTRKGSRRSEVGGIAKSLSDDLISPPPNPPSKTLEKKLRLSSLAPRGAAGTSGAGFRLVNRTEMQENADEEEQEESAEADETIREEQDEEALDSVAREQAGDITTGSEIDIDLTITSTRLPPEEEPTTPRKKGKIRMTPLVETIVVKIWTILGDMLFPGHGTKGPLKANETIALLQNILTLPSAPPHSPSTQSTLASLDSDLVASTTYSTATTQQILTAHILLTVLSSSLPSSALSISGSALPASTSTGTSQQHAMLVQELKQVVTTKLKESALVQQGGGVDEKDVTRALYACVAKKLLMLDWSAGVQVVKFNL